MDLTLGLGCNPQGDQDFGDRKWPPCAPQRVRGRAGEEALGREGPPPMGAGLQGLPVLGVCTCLRGCAGEAIGLACRVTGETQKGIQEDVGHLAGVVPHGPGAAGGGFRAMSSPRLQAASRGLAGPGTPQSLPPGPPVPLVMDLASLLLGGGSHRKPASPALRSARPLPQSPRT